MTTEDQLAAAVDTALTDGTPDRWAQLVVTQAEAREFLESRVEDDDVTA